MLGPDFQNSILNIIKNENKFNDIYISSGNIKALNPSTKNMFQRRIMGLVSYYIGATPDLYAQKTTQYKNLLMPKYYQEIYDHFDSIICGDEVINGKPNPEMFNKTIDRFKINKNECLIFEDSLEGIMAANNSGINVVGITSSSSHKTLQDAGSTMNISNYVDFDLAKI